MQRVIMTVGMNHAGKSTFVRKLESLSDAVLMIENDTRRGFAETYYKRLRDACRVSTRNFDDPDLKTYHMKTMLPFALKRGLHVILANCHTSMLYRKQIIDYVHDLDYKVVIVYFDVAYDILLERARNTSKNEHFYSKRGGVLGNLQRMKEHFDIPISSESDAFLVVKDNVNEDVILGSLLDLIV